MLGKAREALSDVAETIRRIFGEPQVTSLDSAGPSAHAQAERLLSASSRAGLEAARTEERVADLFQEGTEAVAMPPLAAVRQEEQGWEAWASEARVLPAPLFQAGEGGRLEVPPLPKGSRVQTLREPFRTPGTARVAPKVEAGRIRAFGAERAFRTEAHALLAAAFARPFAFQGEDLAKLPKALWMRYSLALVKATGENVRNLEVVGLYRLPRKGFGEMRPDAQGRLWVRLGPEAAGAKRAPFMLARRRDDQGFVSAFVEEP